MDRANPPNKDQAMEVGKRSMTTTPYIICAQGRATFREYHPKVEAKFGVIWPHGPGTVRVTPAKTRDRARPVGRACDHLKAVTSDSRP